MRKDIFLCIILVVTSISSRAFSWESSIYPGLTEPATQGCQASGDEWTCVFLDCQKSKVQLWVLSPGPDPSGPIDIAIDGQRFLVDLYGSENPNSYGKAKEIPSGLLDAMMAGTILEILGAGISENFNKISLKGSGSEITRVLNMCK
ncbi:MAG: hypothetical protein MUC58_12280 [Rhizobiaceae bacterium]|jgi:hypothetical protein|nr:hypothetical protein [Rhizobiaceae bacterium]